MPVASITTTYNNSINEIRILSGYMSDCANLESKYQYFISEVVMLRLFAVLETTLGEVALKLACGALYKNGIAPLTHITCTSIRDAENKMATFGRGRNAIRFLKWNQESDVEKMIRFVLVLTDAYFVNIQNHAVLIDEMRNIRNHIAHRNRGTARNYYQVLRNIYTSNIKITMGAFLNSTARNAIPNIQRYLTSTPIILHDITKG